MHVVGRSLTSRYPLFFDPHISEMAAVEGGARDVVEVSIDNETTRKKGAVSDVDPQSSIPEEVWLIIFQVGDVENSFRAVSRIL